MSAELIARWDAFLDKIQATFAQLMEEARAGCLELLDLNQLDPIAMSNAWMGIRAEVHALSAKIDSTWSEKVEGALEGAGMDHPAVFAQAERGRAVRARIDLECERREIEIFAEAGDRILLRAREIQAQGFRCTQCGGQLPIPERLFRSVHVTCSYCSRVNTFEPGTQVRMVEHFCSHHLSQRAALAEWSALKEAEAQRRRTRGDTIEGLRAREAATRSYWTAYFRARAALIPDFAAELERDIESRMRPFRDEMATNQVWQRHR